MIAETTFHSETVRVSTTRRAARVATVTRTLMGLIFFVFGLGYFLHLFPTTSPSLPEGAAAFGGALAKTGYMFPLIKGTEVVVGALLLTNRFVPLALLVIAPVIVNIVAFHLFLAPSGLVMAGVVLALEIQLAWTHRSAFRGVVAARVRAA